MGSFYKGASLIEGTRIKTYDNEKGEYTKIPVEELKKYQDEHSGDRYMAVYKGNKEPILVEKNEKHIPSTLYTISVGRALSDNDDIAGVVCGDRHNHILYTKCDAETDRRTMELLNMDNIFNMGQPIFIPVIEREEFGSIDINYMLASVNKTGNHTGKPVYEFYFRNTAKTVFFELANGIIVIGVKLNR
jgi:hypothetical protein